MKQSLVPKILREKIKEPKERKERLKKEGNESVTNCNQLKLEASGD